jgi:hypothetical protein
MLWPSHSLNVHDPERAATLTRTLARKGGKSKCSWSPLVVCLVLVHTSNPGVQKRMGLLSRISLLIQFAPLFMNGGAWLGISF